MKPDYKSLSRGNSRDMSPGAINSRLDKVADLYELWKLLRTARRSSASGDAKWFPANNPKSCAT
jgi:hypothetical protein